MSAKPTDEQLKRWRRLANVFAYGPDVDDGDLSVSDLAQELACDFEALLDAYEASQRPIVAEPEHPAPLDVAELPAFWRARRKRAGKNASLCADELEAALACDTTRAERDALQKLLGDVVVLRDAWQRAADAECGEATAMRALIASVDAAAKRGTR